jgi:phosphatidylglycerol:prolipoprotein diacylglycerol transferase
VRVAWHSVFSLVGSFVAALVAVRLSRVYVRDDRVWLCAIAVFLGGLVTARLGHVIDNWSDFASDPWRIPFAGGGIAVTAAPIGSAIACVIAARRLRLPVGLMLDVATLGIVLGLSIGRIGDVINGEHHSVACAALPWCVRYTHPETLGQSTPVHPVVVYDALWDLLLFAVGYLYWRRVRGRPPEGRVWLAVLGLYGAGRFVSSFLRLDPVLLFGLQEAQILGLAYALVALPAVLAIERRHT